MQAQAAQELKRHLGRPDPVSVPTQDASDLQSRNDLTTGDLHLEPLCRLKGLREIPDMGILRSLKFRGAHSQGLVPLKAILRTVDVNNGPGREAATRILDAKDIDGVVGEHPSHVSLVAEFISQTVSVLGDSL